MESFGYNCFYFTTGEYPSKRPVTGSFDTFFDVRLNNRFKNSQDAGDLKRHDAHCDVTVMFKIIFSCYIIVTVVLGPCY